MEQLKRELEAKKEELTQIHSSLSHSKQVRGPDGRNAPRKGTAFPGAEQGLALCSSSGIGL